ncbi:MAG: LamG domain-containing protein [Pseudomonadota bacterium]
MSARRVPRLMRRIGSVLIAGVVLWLAAIAPAWSAITLVGAASVVSTGSGTASLMLAYPAGRQIDDVLIVQIAARGDRTFTAPAGWTLINRTYDGSALTQAVYWARVTATTPASENWGISASVRAAAAVVAYRGADPVAPINAHSVRSNASSTSATASSVSPGVAGTRLVGLFALANGNASFAPPAGMAEQADNNTGAGPNGVAIELADEAYAGGTAATGTRVATASAAAVSVAHLVALQSNLIASYRMDEAVWSGASGQVLDSSGRSFHAAAVNGAGVANATPAIPGTPGTCGYGSFDGSNDYVAVPAGFPNLTADFTLTAWIRTTNNAKSGQRIFIDDQGNTGGYGFSLGDGGTGQLRFYARATSPISLDTGNVIANNTWYFVAATMDAVAKSKRLYVYNQAGTLLASVSQTYTGNWGIDNGAASIGGENNASGESGSNFKFSGNLDEVNVFSGAFNTTQLAAVRARTRPCSVLPPAAPGGFNAFETATPAGSVAGVIRTKVAASAFALDVVALNAAGTALETAFAGDVRVELVDAATGGACAGLPSIRALGTLTFASGDAGRKTLAGINEPNAWPNVRVRMSYPASGAPTVVACSTDPFAIRPASFGAVTASDADSLTAGTARTLANTAVSGGVVHRAGRPFRLAATALNAAGAATSNYAGSPVANGLACVLPATGCVLGSFVTGTWSAAAGTAVTTTASYSEAGALSLRLEDASFAAVDAADGSTLAERTVQSAVFAVGRFVPDYFELATANVPSFRTFNDATCAARSFTYVGQPFGYVTAPQATIVAKNAAGATTQNYAGSLWKLAAAGATQTHAAVTGTLDTGLVNPPVVTAGSAGTGTLAADPADVVAFVRATPVAPFAAAITLTLSIRDDAEAAVAGNGVIDTAVPATFADIAFDAGNAIRFGRLVLANAHGSELLALPVLLEAQYWNGSHFVRNVDDACTQLSAGQVALSNWRRDLAPCETSATLSGRFIAGRGNLRLSAPGAGNTGSVDLSVQLGATASGSACVGGTSGPASAASQSWLQGAWTGGAYDRNPAARASFGLYRGSKTLIYQREIH